MNRENYAKYAALYQRQELGPSAAVDPFLIEEGFSRWTENGMVCRAITVSKYSFGGHSYDNGGYERGMRDCSCGCDMHSCSSSGPVNPFGPCPDNPLTLPETT